jgi:hypothetical protein
VERPPAADAVVVVARTDAATPARRGHPRNVAANESDLCSRGRLRLPPGQVTDKPTDVGIGNNAKVGTLRTRRLFDVEETGRADDLVRGPNGSRIEDTATAQTCTPGLYEAEGR